MMAGDAPAPKTRWTPRAHLFLAFGAGLVFVGVLLRNPVPLFLALPLLSAPFAAAYVIPRRLAKVDLALAVEGSGPEVQIRGALTGAFGSEAEGIDVRLRIPPGFVPTGPMIFEREAEEIRFLGSWKIREPTITTVPAPTVLWRDPMGLHERVLDGERPTLSVERYPPGLRGLSNVRLERTISLPGETRSRRVGASGEFFGLRAARPNEPRRRINWHATARAGKYLVNDYEVDRAGDLVIVLDVRPTGLGREHDTRLLGLGRAAAYAVAGSFLRTKVRVGFATFGEYVEALPLSMGRIHGARILQAVLASELSPTSGLAARCAFGLSRFYRPGVTTLIVSSWDGEPGFDLAPYVRRQGYPVISLSPSPLPLREGTGGLAGEDESLARRTERLERRERLARLWNYGPVVDWENYWSLSGVLHYFHAPSGRKGS